MKRFILFMLAAVIFLPAAFSQNLSLSKSGVPVANGTTILVWGDLTNFIVSYMAVTNNGPSAIDVRLVRTENSIIPGSVNYFCWDQCFDPSVDTSGILTIAAGATNSTHFSGDYAAMGNAGTSNITYTFFDANKPSDNVSFHVNYSASPASINVNPNSSLQVGKAYPNPASGSFSFDYSVPREGQEVKIIVRDMLGSVVQETVVPGGNGTLTLSTEKMKEGIYFYTVSEGNRTLSTRKLVVKQ